jgi:hypothetical protein
MITTHASPPDEMAAALLPVPKKKKKEIQWFVGKAQVDPLTLAEIPKRPPKKKKGKKVQVVEGRP